MPPALPDSLVGRASGPVGAARGALETLLVDLGSQIQRGVPNGRTDRDAGTLETSQVCATGLAALDARLGGGFPRGRLSEIFGPPSSGRTALALTLIRTTLQAGGLTGWIDLADAFDPRSASAQGIALERMLWIRPRSEKQALQSCDRLLQTEGFELVVFDCMAARHTISDVAWLRLSRLAAKTRTALVILSQGSAAGISAVTGSRAALVLEMLPLGAHFAGSPSLLDGLETTAILRRHRTRPSGCEVPIRLRAEPER